MATDVYKLHVEYQGLENKIWRDIEVSGNYLLNRLGYAVLATFDTLAYHLFDFTFGREKFVIPTDEFDEEEQTDMAMFKLEQFKFKIGDKFTMEYDYGTTQTFVFTVTEIRSLEKGKGRAYPKITDGEGYGIIDDIGVNELAEIVSQIEKNGKADEEIYYKDRAFPWNFIEYDIKADNALLKGSIDFIEDKYYPFWENYYGE